MAHEVYEAIFCSVKVVNLGDGIDWFYEILVLFKWYEFEEGGVVILVVERGFKLGLRGQKCNDGFKYGISKME